MVFQTVGNVDELVVDLLVGLTQLVDGLGGTDAGNHVLALGIHQEFAVELLLAVGGVAGEGDAGTGIIAHVSVEEKPSLLDVPLPLGKLLFEEEHPVLEQVRTYLEQRGWAKDYELIFSNESLLELTRRGANKGGMVLRLAEKLGISREHVYCVGDEANDLSMKKRTSSKSAKNKRSACPGRECIPYRTDTHSRAFGGPVETFAPSNPAIQRKYMSPI